MLIPRPMREDHRDPRDWWIHHEPPGFFWPGCPCCGSLAIYSLAGTLTSTPTFTKDVSKYTYDSWTTLTNAQPDPARGQLDAASLGVKGYIFGGRSGISTWLLDVEEYDADANDWASKTDMPGTAREIVASESVSPACYVFGGLTGPVTNRFQDTDKYVPDTWTTKTNMPSPGRSQAGRFVSGANIILSAGISNSSLLQDTDSYDTSGDSWTSKTDCPTPARRDPASATLGGVGYLFGGQGAALLSDTDGYDIAGDSWASETDVPTPARAQMRASVLEAEVVLCGGVEAFSASSNHTDSYDGATWTTRANMSAPGGRRTHGLVTL